MSELILGREVFEVLERNDEAQYEYKGNWLPIDNLRVCDISNNCYKFRLKPRTITINGIECPAPFKPNEGDTYYFLTSAQDKGFLKSNVAKHALLGAWRTESEIKQVVTALRSVF